MRIKMVKLTDAVLPTESWNPLKSKDNYEFQYIDIGAIDQAHKSIREIKTVKCHEAPSRAKQKVFQSDVLVSTVRPNLNGVAFVPNNLDGATASTGFCVLRSNPKILDPEYLFHFVRSPQFIKYLSDKATGASYPAVSDRIILNAQIPLPSIEDQKRISLKLSKASNLIRDRMLSISTLDDYMRSLFIEMFGDPVTNPRGWQIQKLIDFEDFLTSGSRGWAEYYAESGAIFIRIQNVKETRLELDDVAFVIAPDNAEAKRTKVRPGDLLLSITADLGRTCVIPEDIGDAYINQHLALIRLKNINPYYVANFIESNSGRSQLLKLNRAAVKAGLNFKDIRSLEIPVPPIELQLTFESKWRQAQLLRKQLLSSHNELHNLFMSLLTESFSQENRA